ncbi:MAG: hypothetical protein HC807_05165 [Gammaproteobacteria bacterium]|nr:hypothetical protein [Gammaproteobacteria bacterium]
MREAIAQDHVRLAQDESRVEQGGIASTVNGEIVAHIVAELRPFRIYDGPSETHRWALARRALRGANS